MSGFGEDAPLLKAKFGAPRSVFVPGHRIRMNVVPMFLNVFVPWGAFVFTSGITSFWLMYTNPSLAWILVGAVFAVWLWMAFMAAWARRYMADPTWFSYTAIIVLIMAIAGTQTGVANFNTYSKPYFDIKSMKVVPDLDASVTPGKNVMDGGVFNFKQGNHLDSLRTWHFHWKTSYCVAPIITNDTVPMNQQYDFWAVGKDCCSSGASDFRCGAWGFSGTAGGIRVVDQSDLQYYRLAVQQAESIYNIMAPNPIFVQWSASPFLEVESLNQQVFKVYMFMAANALVVCIFLMTCAASTYSFLGRSRSAYSTEMLDDPYWQQGIHAPVNEGTHRYTA